MDSFPDLETYKEPFVGETDIAYLHTHYPRFKMTWEFARHGGKKIETMLDIGAHWLHQCVFYAMKGTRVTAADLPGTFEGPKVQAIVAEYGIQLVTYDDLSQPDIFDSLSENQFDLILFTEILEHITFNPVAMWNSIYRVLKPGGRIIVTTPNYYYIGGRAWNLKRLLARMGGGITPHEILHTPTFGPHWKEFSSGEIIQYFGLLSPDFNVTRIQYRSIPYSRVDNLFGKLQRTLEKCMPILRNNLFAEITMEQKIEGINLNPAW